MAFIFRATEAARKVHSSSSSSSFRHFARVSRCFLQENLCSGVAFTGCDRIVGIENWNRANGLSNRKRRRSKGSRTVGRVAEQARRYRGNPGCASSETWRDGGTTGSLVGVHCARAGVCQHTVSIWLAHREPQQTEKAPGPPGDRRYR